MLSRLEQLLLPRRTMARTPPMPAIALPIMLCSMLSLTLVVSCVGDYTPKPLDLTAWAQKRVLMVAAHPDDIEAAAAGTVALLRAQGTEVAYLIATNGDKGCSAATCQASAPEEIAMLRRGEAFKAAAVVGVNASNVFLLDYEDSMLTSYPEQDVRQRMVAVMRQWKPHVVMTWYPYPDFDMAPSDGWFDLGYHMDHQCSARIALAAHTNAGLWRLWPESGPAWGVEEFYMWEFTRPHLYVDISSVIDKKVAAYEAHATQYPSTRLVNDMIRELAERVANETWAKTPISYAEGFRPFY